MAGLVWLLYLALEPYVRRRRHNFRQGRGDRRGAFRLALVYLLLLSVPITTDFSAWYAGSSLFTLLAVLALAVYGFYTSLAGQPLTRGRLLEE